ncbi:MAG TPA: ion channel [Candidatus Peribacterales bacterium]|nr:ion channel [Candidatus Peribacterales bacterium]
MNIPFMRGGTPKKLRLFTRFIDAIVQLSYQSLFLVWLLLAVVIGGLYFILSFVPGEGPVQLTNIDGTWSRFWNSIYFSFVTVTSTGYGDITPMGASKLLAIFQSILALLVFAVLVTKLVSKQQDVALQQIHKLVFEDVFHNIREGFYIVRKDFDRIIHTAEHGVALTEHNWEDLQTAYRQAQSFLRRIPDFYNPENRLYEIDVRREELLHDGLYRTLTRLKHLINIFEEKNIPWIHENASLEELREFLKLLDVTVKFWQKHSPHGRKEAFDELLQQGTQIHQLIESKVEKN